jgi:peptide/nickel transport system permease protein
MPSVAQSVPRPFLLLMRHRIAGRTLLPAAFLCLVVCAAVFAGVLAPHDPDKQNLALTMMPPSAQYPMGTDALGRDVLSRVIYGARVSLLVGGASVAIAMVIGVLLGIVSAMVGGWVGEAIMRITDVVLALPAVLIALAVAATVGPSLINVIVIIAMLYWAEFARMARGEAMAICKLDYVQSAYAIGCGSFRILRLHILPNLINTVIVMATLQMAAAILLESTLSFLGVGVPPPTATWGLMVADGRPYVQLAWWMVTFPGAGIMLTVLAINLLGDDLRDRLDPKFNRRR